MSRSLEDLFRPATRGWPSTPEEWDLRPYFIFDHDLSWRDLSGYVASDKVSDRTWAVARILDGARWSDIWRLLTPADIERSLDRLPRRMRQAWSGALHAWA